MKRNSTESDAEASQNPKLCRSNVEMTSEQDLEEISKLKDVEREENCEDSVPPLNDIGDGPVFYPTETEFQDPLAYVDSIYKEAEKFGICKVVPPKNWRPPFCINPEELQFTPRVQPLCLLEPTRRLWLTFNCKLTQFWSMYMQKITYPVTVRGLEVDLPEFNYLLVDEFKAASASDLKEISLDAWKGIAMKLRFPDFDVELAGELRDLYEALILPMEKFVENVSTKVKQHKNAHVNACKTGPKKRRMMAGPRRSMKKMMKTTTNSNNDAESFNFDQLNLARVDFKNVCRKCGVNAHLRETILCGSCNAKFHESCIESPPSKTDRISPSRVTFKCSGCTAYKLYNDPLLTSGFSDHNRNFNLCDFGDYADTFKKLHFGVEDPTTIGERKVEKEFWKLVLAPKKPVTVFYGADLHSKDIGSGFPVSKKQNLQLETEKQVFQENEQDHYEYANSGWNLNNFPKLDASVLRHIGSNVSGMTQPWIYVGMVFSAFCWHTEDHWTPSINFLHFGETKSWYGIPGSQAANVDRRIKEYVPSLFHLQPDLMHNLNTMIHPHEMIRVGLQVSRVDQHAGEFVITFPRAYHAGFNQGFNCAEAVNFATSRWLQYGYDSIGHYVAIKRNHVFSHEELISKMASNPSSLNLEDAKEIYVQLSLFVAEEKELLKELEQLGVKPKSRRRVKIEDIENDDERSCFFCSRTLFFSMISCSCRANYASKLKQSCRKHFRLLCRCALSKRQFVYRYTLKELTELEANLYARISSLPL